MLDNRIIEAGTLVDEKHFSMEILDPAKFIQANDLVPVTNPIFFIRDGVPSPDGLLSNEIFGITKDERSNIFSYIDLSEWFIHPLVYKIWCSMDRRIRDIVHGTKKFIVNSSGDFVEDEENGKCGVKFLRDNIDNIKIKSTESIKRDTNIKFIEKNKKVMFIKQYTVIPAFYRDVNSDGGYVGVGDINKLYNSLLIAVRSLREVADYGLSMSDASRGRIQEIILEIYNWFKAEPNLAGKTGIVRRANLSKTADYASRLVLSAPELKAEKLEDIMVDLDHSAVPLASVCVNLFPYMIFYIRRFFENEFGGTGMYPVKDKKTQEIRFIKVKDPLIAFSDERIKHEIERYIKGFSNRFIPIEVPNDEGKTIYMKFKGRETLASDTNKPEQTPLTSRKLTWCDIIYMAAVEVSKDKVALITRYPMDSYFNQFPSKIIVSSTKKTVPMYYDNKFYKYYPYIRAEDIEQDTSNKFIDTLNISNLRLGIIGGDYDGDQVTDKTTFSIEANEELLKHMNSKANYVTLGAEAVVSSSNEAIQSLYNLTLVLSETKLTEPVFKGEFKKI